MQFQLKIQVDLNIHCLSVLVFTFDSKIDFLDQYSFKTKMGIFVQLVYLPIYS